MTLTGEAVDLSAASVSLSSGWTWLGYPLFAPTALGTTGALRALVASDFTDGDVIKSQSSFTTYVQNYGWYGSLSKLEDGQAYMFNLAASNTLTFVASSRRRELATEHMSQRFDASAQPGSSAPDEWRVIPGAFEASMCVTAFVIIDGAASADGVLAAFTDDSLRGVTAASSSPAPVGPYKGYHAFNLMVYGQASAESATLTFRFRHADGHTSHLSGSVVFSADGSIGSLYHPLVITSANAEDTMASLSPPTSRSSMAKAGWASAEEAKRDQVRKSTSQ